jgi:hypothetical protein
MVAAIGKLESGVYGTSLWILVINDAEYYR